MFWNLLHYIMPKSDWLMGKGGSQIPTSSGSMSVTDQKEWLAPKTVCGPLSLCTKHWHIYDHTQQISLQMFFVPTFLYIPFYWFYFAAFWRRKNLDVCDPLEVPNSKSPSCLSFPKLSIQMPTGASPLSGLAIICLCCFWWWGLASGYVRLCIPMNRPLCLSNEPLAQSPCGPGPCWAFGFRPCPETNGSMFDLAHFLFGWVRCFGSRPVPCHAPTCSEPNVFWAHTKNIGCVLPACLKAFFPYPGKCLPGGLSQFSAKEAAFLSL